MKLRDSLAENNSIRLQAEANTWQEAVKIGRRFTGGCRRGGAALLPGHSRWR
ncbi:sugar phosphotransferase [Salmonella enterica subsp. enterica]|nr:sugar phosphotransferase [Salmonella enterica subsp. enterica]